MSALDDLEKLALLYRKKVITKKEYELQRQKLLSSVDGTRKSQMVYCILAFFLGGYGVHNFYVGRWKQGLGQVLMTLLSMWILSPISCLWAVINIWVVHTDGRGKEFVPSKGARLTFGILGVLSFLIMFVGSMMIAGQLAKESDMPVESLVYSQTVDVKQQRKVEGIEHVVLNPDVKATLEKCENVGPSDACVLYVQNQAHYDKLARDFFKDVAKDTGRPLFLIEADNVRYSAMRIPPEHFAEIKVPMKR